VTLEEHIQDASRYLTQEKQTFDEFVVPTAQSIANKKVKLGVVTSKKDSAQIRVNQIDNKINHLKKHINHKRLDNYHDDRHIRDMRKTIGSVVLTKLSVSQQIEGTMSRTSSRSLLERTWSAASASSSTAASTASPRSGSGTSAPSWTRSSTPKERRL
jgi:hypothetical protein